MLSHNYEKQITHSPPPVRNFIASYLGYKCVWTYSWFWALRFCFDEIRQIRPSIDEPWIIGGDFNTVRSTEDSCTGRATLSETTQLKWKMFAIWKEVNEKQLDVSCTKQHAYTTQMKSICTAYTTQMWNAIQEKKIHQSRYDADSALGYNTHIVSVEHNQF
jgi:hypothetical protein